MPTQHSALNESSRSFRECWGQTVPTPRNNNGGGSSSNNGNANANANTSNSSGHSNTMSASAFDAPNAIYGQPQPQAQHPASVRWQFGSNIHWEAGVEDFRVGTQTAPSNGPVMHLQAGHADSPLRRQHERKPDVHGTPHQPANEPSHTPESGEGGSGRATETEGHPHFGSRIPPAFAQQAPGAGGDPNAAAYANTHANNQTNRHSDANASNNPSANYANHPNMYAAPNASGGPTGHPARWAHMPSGHVAGTQRVSSRQRSATEHPSSRERFSWNAQQLHHHHHHQPSHNNYRGSMQDMMPYHPSWNGSHGHVHASRAPAPSGSAPQQATASPDHVHHESREMPVSDFSFPRRYDSPDASPAPPSSMPPSHHQQGPPAYLYPPVQSNAYSHLPDTEYPPNNHNAHQSHGPPTYGYSPYPPTQASAQQAPPAGNSGVSVMYDTTTVYQYPAAPSSASRSPTNQQPPVLLDPNGWLTPSLPQAYPVVYYRSNVVPVRQNGAASNNTNGSSGNRSHSTGNANGGRAAATAAQAAGVQQPVQQRGQQNHVAPGRSQMVQQPPAGHYAAMPRAQPNAHATDQRRITRHHGAYPLMPWHSSAESAPAPSPRVVQSPGMSYTGPMSHPPPRHASGGRTDSDQVRSSLQVGNVYASFFFNEADSAPSIDSLDLHVDPSDLAPALSPPTFPSSSMPRHNHNHNHSHNHNHGRHIITIPSSNFANGNGNSRAATESQSNSTANSTAISSWPLTASGASAAATRARRAGHGQTYRINFGYPAGLFGSDGELTSNYDVLLLLDDNRVRLGISSDQLKQELTAVPRDDSLMGERCVVCLDEFLKEESVGGDSDCESTSNSEWDSEVDYPMKLSDSSASSKPEVSRLPCSHLYHTRCIKKWLSANTRCPVCNWDKWKGGRTVVNTPRESVRVYVSEVW
ncbi:hypothetical protein DIPPA_19786 [Diplonema papillatum]|nr:hypothetical protein DIPPA_19786 [Diplonema papillatum]